MAEEEDRGPANQLELHGNQQTMNLENILHLNILQSPYFKDLLYVFFASFFVIDTIFVCVLD